MKKIRYLLFSILFMTTFQWGIGQTNPSHPLAQSFQEYQSAKEKTLFDFHWIGLGPVVNSARVEAVQLHPDRPALRYAAFGSGNLWKSTNHGLNWVPIFENQPVYGIGDMAIAPSNPDIIYVGTGESLKKARNFTMPGNGVYRSNDGGDTWVHLGLEHTWHIGEIVVHPQNPDIVYVAALGHFWTENEARGVYRSLNGGQTWEHVLYVDTRTGANDIVIAPSDPNTLYASMWENFPGIAGSNSGIYKSTNGGETWKRLSNGLPDGPKTGRIGIAVSASDPNKAYALIDNLNLEKRKAAEVYKTIDGGGNWAKSHQDTLFIFPGIGWYFTDIYTDPQNDETIYALGVRMAKSIDGGKSFELVGGTIQHINPSPAQTLHLDHCELWIDPKNSKHLVLGNDGGLFESYDQGQSWLHYNNIPAGEFYQIEVSQDTNYLIYGGTQDDATVFGPAKEWIPNQPDPWQYLWIDAWSGGDGCFTQLDPKDPNTVYFSMQNGAIRRRNQVTGQSIYIGPKHPKGDQQFNFIAPYFISPHHAQTLYAGGNYLFKSTNRGDGWEVISPNFANSQERSQQNIAAGAIAESPIQKGLLYVGMDRGSFWTTKDDGKNWTENYNGLPEAYIRGIVPSKYAPGRIYLTAAGINYDDFNNYVYVSEDYGKTWQSIKQNLPNEISYTILEDPIHENLLYLGTFRGVYFSYDRGNSWHLMSKTATPKCVSDLKVHLGSSDLIIGTHGRGIYKINLNPIYDLQEKGWSFTESHLFEVPSIMAPKLRDTHKDIDKSSIQKLTFSFWLKEKGVATFKILDQKENLLFKKAINGGKGFNQWRWNLSYQSNESQHPYFIQYQQFLGTGIYQIQLNDGQKILKQNFEIR